MNITKAVEIFFKKFLPSPFTQKFRAHFCCKELDISPKNAQQREGYPLFSRAAVGY